MNRIKSFFVYLCILFIFAGTVNAGSIFSEIGLGNYMLPVSVRSAGMGNVGLAIREDLGVPYSNPALLYGHSYVTLESNIIGDWNFVSAGSGLFQEVVLGRFAFKFPLGSKSSMALSFQPITHTQASFILKDSLYVNDKWQKYNSEGEAAGGISGIYFGFGRKLMKELSVGINYVIYTGQLEKVNRINFYGTGFLESNISDQLVLRGQGIDLGVTAKFPGKAPLTAGLVYSVPLSVKGKKIIDYESTNRMGSIFAPDDTLTIKSINFPSRFGLGFVYRGKNWMVGADYQYIQYSESLLDNLGDPLPPDFSIRPLMEWGIGFEKFFSGQEYTSFLNRIIWRFGVNGSDGYLEMSGKHFQSTGLTFGIGYPFQGLKNRLDIAVQFGKRTGVLDKFKENYIRLNVNIITGDRWFLRNKRR
jgi:hypothetical protein